MKQNLNLKNKLLNKKSFFLLFFLIISFIFIRNVDAAYFEFKDFDFNQFVEDNKAYWTDLCADDEEDPNKCYDAVIYSQKNYYTRLYKILAEYQKGTSQPIDDNIIIATTFYGLTPRYFNDVGTNYFSLFKTNKNAYNYDENITSYEADSEVTYDWFENETDTLDLLIRNLFTYSNSCYAVYGSPTVSTDDEGREIKTCANNAYIVVVDGEEKCGIRHSTESMGFIEYMSRKSGFGTLLSLFKKKNSSAEKCENNADKYPDATMKSVLSNGREYNPEAYWEFLEETNYFDKKDHLQSYFTIVLAKTKKKNMYEVFSDVEHDYYEEYEEDIISARKQIISHIKHVLETYKSPVSNYNFTSISNDKYWWPIGSSNVNASDGVSFANGEPASTSISSYFGKRNDPFTGVEELHGGVDIAGARGTNIIASKNGIVIKVVTGCVEGDLDCGGSYGNHVAISHSDGNFTYYAHLQENSITVKENDNVKQGQVIGQIGSTGNSTGPHLHFEVRIGSDQYSSTVNPFDYVSKEEPRPVSGVSDQLDAMLICLEGSSKKDRTNEYHVYKDIVGVLTVGHGITLKNNPKEFKAYGIDVSDYYYEGAYISKEIVDKVKYDVITKHRDAIITILSREGITLEPHQIDALIVNRYQRGNIGGFVDAYKKYGNTTGLRDNYFGKSKKISGGSLSSRREREWNLFHTGTYFTC